MSDCTLSDLRRIVETLWPAAAAEDWDRVGLVCGRDEAPVRRVLLAVDAVRATVDQAIESGADVLLTHHPLLLRGVHTIAEDTAKGALLAALIRGDCALLAAHTNADAPVNGVSDVLAQRLGLRASAPIAPSNDPLVGIGRTGQLPEPISLKALAARVADMLPTTATGVRVAGDPDRPVSRVALCGGAGDSLLGHRAVLEADVYITSDLRHHPAQESLEQSAVSGGPALIDVSHWASESLWLEAAAEQLRHRLPEVEFIISTVSTDPWTFAVR